MSKQTVNIGTSANDRTGDSLRTAFNKINENFTELYTALGLNDDILNIGSLELSGSTITTTDSSGIILGQQVTITSDLLVDGGFSAGEINFSDDSSRPIDQTAHDGYVQVIVNGLPAWIRYYR
jgi:hypothetical protein